jgi:hypothetical protein
VTSEKVHTARKSGTPAPMLAISIANQPQVAIAELPSHRMLGLLFAYLVEQAFSAGIASF